MDVIRRLAARRVASALGNALQRHAYNYSTAPLRSPSTQVLTVLTTDIRTASLVNVTFLYTSHLFNRFCSTLVCIIVMYIPIPCRPAAISASLFLKSQKITHFPYVTCKNPYKVLKTMLFNRNLVIQLYVITNYSFFRNSRPHLVTRLQHQ